MSTINTLGELLNAANSEYLVFDLGRRVQPIATSVFQAFENLQLAYPYPIQGHAQFAIVFGENKQQPFIWFLKFPLDERGLLNPAARSQFLQMLSDAMGDDITRPLTEEEQQRMANHPFNVRPSQEKLAIFNAQLRRQLKQPASAQYEFACQYLSGKTDAQLWQSVGLQGLADICARAEDFEHAQLLSNALSSKIVEIQTASCQLLEHVTLPTSVMQTVETLFSHAEAKQRSYLLRAVASSPDCCNTLLRQMAASHEKLEQTQLIAVAARCWNSLKQDDVRKFYLESLALQPQSFFNQIFADIVAIPDIRHPLLSELRNPDRSERLSQAIGGLFKAMTQ
ncbi:hypothetical protein HR45_12340 [Shewanella mangrovi]|uniref:DUF3549 domain-containing protein n=1 Tax=Shewanella mangrovi TaxID=1515746 RepID=A0A094JGN1_9GAMM|nr:DUF3549 family protein [Shewanella mangrovi]KFZ37194.1 hypothetical protein HR45_12340 [Shewanella mangrovi]